MRETYESYALKLKQQGHDTQLCDPSHTMITNLSKNKGLIHNHVDKFVKRFAKSFGAI